VSADIGLLGVIGVKFGAIIVESGAFKFIGGTAAPGDDGLCSEA